MSSNDQRGSSVDEGDFKEAPTRACDGCRKMKIRCIGKENPPCKRCRTMGLDCRFESSGTRIVPEEIEMFTKATKTRLESLEGQVGGINQKLDDISTFLRSMARPPTPAVPSPHTVLSAPTLSNEPANVHTFPSLPSQAPTNPSPNAARWTDTTLPASGSTWHFSPRRSESQPVPIALNDADSDSDEDDPIQSAMQWEPHRDLTRREEEHRLRAEGYATSPVTGKWATLAAEVGHRTKRRRVDSDATGDDVSVGVHPPVRPHGVVFYSADPVTLGWCSEEEGRTLFDLFFKHAYPFMPILDPREDTWEDLRRRSPFLVTVILLVSLRARDGCGMPSDLTRKCRDQAENMAKLTLFSPVSTLETVQGLTLLSSWTEHGWRSCCHAMSMAVDMRLYRCLTYLQKTRLEPNRSSERQRSLVVGARVWLALVKQGYELSFNHAMPVQFNTPLQIQGERTRYARDLLEHPLSNIWDSRLVVSVELLEARESQFHPFQTVPVQSADLDEQLREANRKIHDHFEYWADYYRRMGLADDHYLVREVKSQRSYAIMYTNSRAWAGVRNKNDMMILSRERRQWLGAAVRAAAYLLSSIGAGPQAKDSEYANHSFHTGIVAVARYLIRTLELLPEACDLYQVSLDIDKLLLKLPHYPAHPFTDILRRAVGRAREQGVLPLTTISEDATRASATAPPPVATTESQTAIEQLLTGFNPLPWDQLPAQAQTQSPLEYDAAAMMPTVGWQEYPDDLNFLANWFAGIDGSSLLQPEVVPDATGAGWLPRPTP